MGLSRKRLAGQSFLARPFLLQLGRKPTEQAIAHLDSLRPFPPTERELFQSSSCFFIFPKKPRGEVEKASSFSKHRIQGSSSNFAVAPPAARLTRLPRDPPWSTFSRMRSPDELYCFPILRLCLWSGGSLALKPSRYMYFEGYGYRGSTFEHTYRCYPASFIDKPQLESGDKIIMPPSALDRLASLHIEYPMLFEVHNAAAERTSHCGVLEFIAEEGMIYMPYWMMQNLLLQEGDMVFIKNANLPKGTYVKLQPHTTDFLDISNPKAILEKTLRNYSCLTTGDSIMVAYNNKKYYIDIVETKPSHAISIIETDCEVDFAPPLDYKEPEKPKPTVPLNAAPTAEAAVEEEPKFTPFTGSGRRLDGKASKDKDVLASSPAKRQANASNGVQPSTSSTSQSSSSRKPTGKLVFGSGGSRDKAPEKEAKEEPKKEEPKFAAFTGKKYSLKG
ncbi:hypothetical protein PR202_ga06669 [Eleusine coracana subsp. coracana]|uniref:Uncharacterized protein n=1 Tax=Eleusine coracana subsp. coracana TaxID=191504 RepID=A0AAV5BWM4_ELECO|nr:hypothetical protein PR202_ga06669 [Eleusine coracana subsp. coracana]